MTDKITNILNFNFKIKYNIVDSEEKTLDYKPDNYSKNYSSFKEFYITDVVIITESNVLKLGIKDPRKIFFDKKLIEEYILRYYYNIKIDNVKDTRFLKSFETADINLDIFTKNQNLTKNIYFIISLFFKKGLNIFIDSKKYKIYSVSSPQEFQSPFIKYIENQNELIDKKETKINNYIDSLISISNNLNNNLNQFFNNFGSNNFKSNISLISNSLATSSNYHVNSEYIMNKIKPYIFYLIHIQKFIDSTNTKIPNISELKNLDKNKLENINKFFINLILIVNLEISNKNNNNYKLINNYNKLDINFNFNFLNNSNDNNNNNNIETIFKTIFDSVPPPPPTNQPQSPEPGLLSLSSNLNSVISSIKKLGNNLKNLASKLYDDNIGNKENKLTNNELFNLQNLNGRTSIIFSFLRQKLLLIKEILEEKYAIDKYKENIKKIEARRQIKSDLIDNVIYDGNILNVDKEKNIKIEEYEKKIYEDIYEKLLSEKNNKNLINNLINKLIINLRDLIEYYKYEIKQRRYFNYNYKTNNDALLQRKYDLFRRYNYILTQLALIYLIRKEKEDFYGILNDFYKNNSLIKNERDNKNKFEFSEIKDFGQPINNEDVFKNINIDTNNELSVNIISLLNAGKKNTKNILGVNDEEKKNIFSKLTELNNIILTSNDKYDIKYLKYGILFFLFIGRL